MRLKTYLVVSRYLLLLGMVLILNACESNGDPRASRKDASTVTATSKELVLDSLRVGAIGKEYQLNVAIPEVCDGTYPGTWQVIKHSNNTNGYDDLYLARLLSASAQGIQTKYENLWGYAHLQVNDLPEGKISLKLVDSFMLIAHDRRYDDFTYIMNLRKKNVCEDYDAGSLMQELGNL